MNKTGIGKAYNNLQSLIAQKYNAEITQGTVSNDLLLSIEYSKNDVSTILRNDKYVEELNRKFVAKVDKLNELDNYFNNAGPFKNIIYNISKTKEFNTSEKVADFRNLLVDDLGLNVTNYFSENGHISPFPLMFGAILNKKRLHKLTGEPIDAKQNNLPKLVDPFQKAIDEMNERYDIINNNVYNLLEEKLVS